jgi:acyl carrier protein
LDHTADRVDGPTLRRLVVERGGVDPGELAPASRLADLGFVGFDLLLLIAVVEDAYQVDFPADLVTALETVDDLLHYIQVKASQRG